MGSHFVSLKNDTGFWMSDGIARLWLFLLASHIFGDFEPDSLASQIRTQWMDAAKIEGSGIVWDALSLYGSDRKARAIITLALDRLTTALSAAPEVLPSEMLGVLGFDLGSGKPIRTERLLDLARAWSDLLKGRALPRARSENVLPDPIWITS